MKENDILIYATIYIKFPKQVNEVNQSQKAKGYKSMETKASGCQDPGKRE